MMICTKYISSVVYLGGLFLVAYLNFNRCSVNAIAFV
jgi:hypothetical protein